jgi:hypothetical protein
MIDDSYTYEGNNGVTYHGDVAYVLNYLDSAQAAMENNFRDLLDGSMSEDDVRYEVRLYDAVSYIIDHPQHIAPHIA